MPTIDASGTPIIRTAGVYLKDLEDALVARFGKGLRNPANSLREISEAFAALPYDELEQSIADILAEFDPNSSSLISLANQTWPIYEPRTQEFATGIVQINYNNIPTTPTPFFAAGTIDFIDATGKRFTLALDVNPPANLFLSAQTGTASETVDTATITRIAQKFTLGDDTDYPLAIMFKAAWISTQPTVTVRIETDSAGLPSGTLAADSLVKTGVLPLNGSDTSVVFEQGAFPGAGTYWLVITMTATSATFDGGVGGTVDQVMKYTGGLWVLSANLENMKVRVVEGGQAEVIAAEFGEDGNIGVDSIIDVRFTDGATQTRWNTNVASFSNLAEFETGADAETAAQYRARVRVSRSGRNTASLDGIIAALQDNTLTPGVRSADGIENDTEDWVADDVFFNGSASTGTPSETIDTVTNTRIAQKIVVSDYRSAVAGALKLNTNAASVYTVRLETDTAGSPSGTLAHADFTQTGVTPGGTTRVTFLFTDGEFLPVGTYWLVFTSTAGSATFDGETASGDALVKYYNGAWNASTVDNIAVDLIGGLPPGSIHLWVDEGTSDNIAQTIYNTKAGGIYSDGPVSGTAVDIALREKTIQFDRPVDVPLVFSIEVSVTSEFGGDEDTIRELLRDYIDGEVAAGSLGVSAEYIIEEGRARLIHGSDATIGVYDIIQFWVGRKSLFPLPSNLTSANDVNIPAERGERFTFDIDIDADITITQV